MPPREPLATPAEVAEYLGVEEKTLANWRSLGKGPDSKFVGREIRYPWPGVEKWLKDQPARRPRSRADRAVA
jgi:hypothetical protein